MKWKSFKEDPPRDNHKPIIVLLSIGMTILIMGNRYKIKDEKLHTYRIDIRLIKSEKLDNALLHVLNGVEFWTYVNIPAITDLRKMVKTKNACVGCDNSCYNKTEEFGCWYFFRAKMIPRLRVGIDDPPPYDHDAEYRLDCYRVRGYAFLNNFKWR